MREHVHSASLRRDQRLAQVRNLTLWIAGSGAVASLALGTVFAHSIPGHAASTPSTGSGATTGGRPAANSAGPTSQGTQHHRRHHRLSAPASAPTSKPAPAPAPPPVVSGGS